MFIFTNAWESKNNEIGDYQIKHMNVALGKSRREFQIRSVNIASF